MRTIARFSLRLFRTYKREFTFGKPAKPIVINLLANDICNSKCQMCYIWKQKKDIELAPDELGKILRDPLFSEVKHVGITGGEPTLRKDLPILYEACINNLPSLVGMSIITNAIQYKQVTSRIEAVKTVCDQSNIGFSAMVSIDGLGEVHDQVRGRSGNFDSAIQTMEFLTGLLGRDHVAFGCTITKDNVWNMHTFLDFIEKRGYYGRFRIAEYINRLYNEEASAYIRTFDDDETYELTTFFMRLIEGFESNRDYQRTYYNIIHMLNGGSRIIKCPYQTKGVVLDCRGNMQYCAPKSNSIGNALKTSAEKLWRGNIHERNRILKEDCDDCIHDYHAPESAEELLTFAQKELWRRTLHVNNYQRNQKLIPLLAARYARNWKKQIFITGWYGTETVGDKAILGGIVLELRQKYPNHELVISTLTNRFVVNRTLRELQIEAEVVEAHSSQFVAASFNSEITIMGGGPLMDMNSMAVPLWAFTLAQYRNRQTILWGCGLGPLKTDKFLTVTRNLLEKSSTVWLRDNTSIRQAQDILPGITAFNIGDPAQIYLRSMDFSDVHPKKDFIACFLREWPMDYSDTDDTEKFEAQRREIEKNLASLIIEKSEAYGLPVKLFPMHTLDVGGDDRVFARRFLAEHLGSIDADYFSKPSSVHDIAHAMHHAKFNICMRFHSVLFASELQTEFVAIDYTMGGKIQAYLQDRNQMDRYLSIEHFLADTGNRV